MIPADDEVTSPTNLRERKEEYGRGCIGIVYILGR
jgi:hypothetical protein